MNGHSVDYQWDQTVRQWVNRRTGDMQDTMPMPETTAALLNERQTTHGDFTMNALYGQQLRALFRQSSGWTSMPAVQKEALDMIACKVSRILSGQSKHADHWKDVAGYAALALTACDD